MTESDSKGFDVSVVICTYNGKDRLPEVLDALMVQMVPSDLRWELLVIDNNSTDSTSEVASAYISRCPVPLKVVVEKEQGLVYARRKGVLASTGSLISFLDDDTIVNADWVHRVREFFAAHPKAGLVGPKILPKLDVQAPECFDLVKRALGVVDMGDETLELTHSKWGHPIGPHSGCRREAIAPCLCRDSFEVTGRRGNSLSSCEDSVLAFEVRRAGWQWWYEPRMQMQHHITSNRLTESYLRRLMAGMGESAAGAKTAELGRPLRLNEILGGIWGHGLRYAYYSGLGFLARCAARRQFSRILTAGFRAGIRSYLRELQGRYRKG